MPTRLETVASAPASLLARDVARLAPTLDRRAWWLREALAADPGAPCPPLRGRTTADVVIVGGGFTGLWTAWNLVEQAPGIRVVILEADIVGGGASGRNGGFLAGWWATLPGAGQGAAHVAPSAPPTSGIPVVAVVRAPAAPAVRNTGGSGATDEGSPGAPVRRARASGERAGDDRRRPARAARACGGPE